MSQADNAFSWFSKAHEGSNYNDGTSGADKVDNAIQPGKTYTYIWKVPDRAGPGKDGPACATWAYYSDVNPIKDTNSGLIGPLVICKKVKTNVSYSCNENNSPRCIFETLDSHTSKGHEWKQVSSVTEFELSLFFFCFGRVMGHIFFILHLQGLELVLVHIFS